MIARSIRDLETIAKFVRYDILVSTTEAGSGHPTSSLSAVELMVALLFGGVFHFDLKNPGDPTNDRLIFSKGHAAPLLYALYHAAGVLSEEELKTLRKKGSMLEGHPRPIFPYVDAATGSLGQGLSIGLGMALNAKFLDRLPYRTFVLMGDSEMSEGSIWEAIQLAVHYKLDNLIGIIDVNRLGQRGETMLGHHVQTYRKRIASFGWMTYVVNGHSMREMRQVYGQAVRVEGRPTMIIARTIKGKGVSFLENKEGWHGKPLKSEECAKAVKELGRVDHSVRTEIAKPKIIQNAKNNGHSFHAFPPVSYPQDKPVATRRAYGNALVRIYPRYSHLVALDAEVSNSTFSEIFKAAHPDRFFEMYIAEQNMVGVALGLSSRGKMPFVSTFAAFLTRAFDQIRMSVYSEANIKFVGSHAGVSIGEDGPSQMGIEDLAMFRSLLNSVVLYPADAVAAEKLVEEAARHRGIVYLRTTRKETPILYDSEEPFPIGGSKVLRQSEKDLVTVVSAGVTLFESLEAYETLRKEGVLIRVIDCYSVKPLDVRTFVKAASETETLVVVEDHVSEGGIGEAVAAAVSGFRTPVVSLAVRKMPGSGKPKDLFDLEEISAASIIKKIREVHHG